MADSSSAISTTTIITNQAAEEDTGEATEQPPSKTHQPSAQPSEKAGGAKAPFTKKDGKKGEDAGHLCANCGQPGPQRCTICGVAHYCSNNMVMKDGKLINACQQVVTSSLLARAISIRPAPPSLLSSP